MTTTHLICTDLDRTLIPNGSQEEAPLARARFANIFKQHPVKLAYVSGRSISLVEEGIAEYGLPLPNVIIADVGASIYHATEDGWLPDENWHNLIAQDWQGRSWQSIVDILSPIDTLRLQDTQTNQSCPHKLSYFTPPHVDSKNMQHHAERLLADSGYRSRAIWSFDEAKNSGLLDILPTSASKLHAIEFVLKTLQLDNDHCLFAGDSGNDLEALESAIPSVLVANASPETRRKAISNAKRLNNDDKLYLAQYLSELDNGNYAGGILQGIAHFFPDLYSS